VEWYWAYADFRDNMQLVKQLFRHIAQAVYGRTAFETRGHTFDLADEWEEIDYATVIKQRLDIDIFKDTEEQMLDVLTRQGVQLDGSVNRNRLVDNLWKVIRKTITGPAFLINEPMFLSPLAKVNPDNPYVTQRFHVLIGGSELGNGYSEINDPQDQLDRFLEQQRLRDAGDEEAQMLDIDYIEMLEYGMPPTSGYGQSERVFWFFEDVSAREGTLFPLMRKEINKATKKIYAGIVELEPASESADLSNDESSAEGLPSKEEAEELLHDHVQDDYQRLHAHMVANALEAYAKKFSVSGQLWYITGLLHDLDYYEHPDEHPHKSLEWFNERNFPEELVHAVAAHASHRTQVEPQSLLAKTLMATDELAGLLYAYSLMRDTGFEGMEVKGAKKKLKDISFAAKVDRQEIYRGVELMQIELDEHIALLIDVFKNMPEFQK
jgi:predicted hydrolase (HD superfamily)